MPFERTITLLSSSPRLGGRPSRHHPAAGVLAFGLEVDRLALLQQLERRRPELQVQNLALARQHVVLDVQPQHGRQVRLARWRPPPGAPVRPVRPSPASIACSVSARHCERFRMLLVIARTCARRDPSRDNRSAAGSSISSPHVRRRLLLQVVEPDHDVGHLHAGVVDVVLHFDAVCRARAACGRTCRPERHCAGGRCARPCWD